MGENVVGFVGEMERIARSDADWIESITTRPSGNHILAFSISFFCVCVCVIQECQRQTWQFVTNCLSLCPWRLFYFFLFFLSLFHFLPCKHTHNVWLLLLTFSGRVCVGHLAVWLADWSRSWQELSRLIIKMVGDNDWGGRLVIVYWRWWWVGNNSTTGSSFISIALPSVCLSVAPYFHYFPLRDVNELVETAKTGQRLNGGIDLMMCRRPSKSPALLVCWAGPSVGYPKCNRRRRCWHPAASFGSFGSFFLSNFFFFLSPFTGWVVAHRKC